MTSRIPADLDCESVLAVLLEASLEAARITMRGFGGTGPHELKADASPVTETDRAAERAIEERLTRALPGVPIVAEEAISAGDVPADLGRFFILVDPLDGTREFIGGIGEFTVNVALVADGRAVAGVVVVPATGEVFVGSPAGAFKAAWNGAGADTGMEFRPIAVRGRPERPRVVVSRSRAMTSELETFLTDYPSAELLRMGSSLKFCRIAEGGVDLYPCLGGTMEWDTAAAQAVLEAAGGRVTHLDGSPLLYGKRGRQDAPDFLNPSFLAFGGADPRPTPGGSAAG